MKKLLISSFLMGLFLATPIQAADNPVVEMVTSMGTVKIELYPEKAPITVKNFLKYVDDGFYNGTIFHRVIPKFMAQGGGYTPALEKKKTNPPIKNEAGNGLSNKRGTISMARTPEPDSASAQFFINVVDNSAGLDRDLSQRNFGYAVFGKVTSGMDVIDKIVDVETKTVSGFGRDVPVKDILIKKIKRVKQ